MHLLFIKFIFFYCSIFDCFSQENQPEDHWRWRHNIDINVRVGDQLYGPIPVQKIHENLKNVEQNMTTNITNHLCLGSNMATAAITVVYEDNNRVLKLRNRWVSLNQDHMNQIYYFPSNASTNTNIALTPTVKFAGPLGGHFERMLNHWPTNLALANIIAGYQNLRNLITHYLSDPPAYQRQFNHSEQRIMDYLSRPLIPNNQPRLINMINNMGINLNSIKLIIVHIHSALDPCDNCSKSLSLFSHYMNHIIRQNWPDARFLITVSSRRSDGNSRHQEGYDNLYNSRIIIDVANFNPPPPALAPVHNAIPAPPPPPQQVHSVIPEQTLQLLGVQPQNPQNANILYFRTVFPDLPRLQSYFARFP
jgi:hypothetical protein